MESGFGRGRSCPYLLKDSCFVPSAPSMATGICSRVAGTYKGSWGLCVGIANHEPPTSLEYSFSSDSLTVTPGARILVLLEKYSPV